MIFQYQKTRKAVEVVNDLIKIHNDRIAGYQIALQSAHIDQYLHNMISGFIAQACGYKKQLEEKVKQMDGDSAKGTTMLGKIYRVWMDLKIKFATSTRKAVVASCQYNEEIALHVYNAALNTELENEIRTLVAQQEVGLRETLMLIKSCKDPSRQFMNAGLVYFN